MAQNNIEYWTKFSFDRMRKERTLMPPIILKVLEMEEFKSSGVSEDELRQSIKERFASERKAIVNKTIEKLKKLKPGDTD